MRIKVCCDKFWVTWAHFAIYLDHLPLGFFFFLSFFVSLLAPAVGGPSVSAFVSLWRECLELLLIVRGDKPFKAFVAVHLPHRCNSGDFLRHLSYRNRPHPLKM